MRPHSRILLVLSLVATVLLPIAGPAVAGDDRHGPPGGGSPDAVLAWNGTATAAAVACGFTPDGNPVYESRLYAMTHIAIHDALNAIRPVYSGYAYSPDHSQPDASAQAAVAAAAAGVLKPGLQEIDPACSTTLVQQAYDSSLAAIPDGPAKVAGIAVGVAAAAAIIEKRGTDLKVGAPLTQDEQGGFQQGTKPGEWRFTPDRPFAFLPNWGKVPPFTAGIEQFAPRGPYDLDSRAYARDLNEVKNLGGDGVTTPSARTPDQTEIALFWVNSAPLQWNAVARDVTVDRHSRMGLWDTARLFAVLNMALADGYIASWATKFLDPGTRLFWRPVTAIRLADQDGNRFTVADPTWTPLVTTPPIPDYDSGHAVAGAVAAAVLAQFFGDRTRFSVCSVSLPTAGNSCIDPTRGTPTVVHDFRSFSQAATENGLSRIYVGFHFRKAVTDGLRHGGLIGRQAATTLLRPVGR